MKILELEAEQPFEVTGVPGLKGTVISHGDGGTRVKYAGDSKRTITTSKDGETKTVSFDVPNTAVVISSGTEVTAL
jgi:hypothetical protein